MMFFGWPPTAGIFTLGMYSRGYDTSDQVLRWRISSRIRKTLVNFGRETLGNLGKPWETLVFDEFSVPSLHTLSVHPIGPLRDAMCINPADSDPGGEILIYSSGQVPFCPFHTVISYHIMSYLSYHIQEQNAIVTNHMYTRTTEEYLIYLPFWTYLLLKSASLKVNYGKLRLRRPHLWMGQNLVPCWTSK